MRNRSIANRISVRIRPMLLMWGLSLFVGGTVGAQTATPLFDPATFALALTPVADGFERPVDLVDAGDRSGRLFVVEQAGRVLIVRDGVVGERPFLDISDRVGCCGERGLLSVVFHPDYEANGQLYVDYTDLNGDTQIARFTVSADDPNRVDLSTAVTLLTVDQPASNHNGGRLVFGPDGFLYISLGDGGGGNGPNGQKLDTLLGKLLRIDVDHEGAGVPYAIPADNPFVTTPNVRPEIWAFGLRNPWRFDFDQVTGDIWIGDVGSSTYEEVNLLPANSGGGQNFGWNAMEGTACRDEAGFSACEEFVAPVSGFDRDAGCVVTGGTVYRGQAVPDLMGVYLFADYCGAGIWGVGRDAEGNLVTAGPIADGASVVSFGRDADNELYVVEIDGQISKIVAASSLR